MESQNHKKEAEKWAERLLDILEDSELNIQQLIKEHDAAVDIMVPAYAERLLQCLREHGSDAAPIIRWWTESWRFRDKCRGDYTVGTPAAGCI